jgi:hypothetical protein
MSRFRRRMTRYRLAFHILATFWAINNPQIRLRQAIRCKDYRIAVGSLCGPTTHGSTTRPRSPRARVLGCRLPGPRPIASLNTVPFQYFGTGSSLYAWTPKLKAFSVEIAQSAHWCPLLSVLLNGRSGGAEDARKRVPSAVSRNFLLRSGGCELIVLEL